MSVRIDLTHVARHELLAGLSGKGKSTLARHLAHRHPAPWKFAFETWKREYSRPAPDGLGWAPCIDEHRLRAAVLAGRPSAFYGEPLYSADRIGAFEFWIQWVCDVGKELEGGKLIVIEEIEKTTPHENCPLHPALSLILDEYRGYKFDVLVCAQRFSTTSRLIRAQTTHMGLFQMVDPTELSSIEQFGFDRGTVEKLERGQYIWRERETGQMLHTPWNARTGPASARVPRTAGVLPKRDSTTGQFLKA